MAWRGDLDDGVVGVRGFYAGVVRVCVYILG
jgi:hypothetical protein